MPHAAPATRTTTAQAPTVVRWVAGALRVLVGSCDPLKGMITSQPGGVSGAHYIYPII